MRPEKIRENGFKISKKRDYAERWEQAQDEPDKDTEIPAGTFQHPDRSWTKEDEERLLDIVECGEQNFARIAQQIQRAEDQCHRKYQFLACLEVKEPRVGQWSAEQDAMLVRFVEEYKITDWDRIAFHCGTTTGEAHQYWASRKSTTSSQPAKSSNSNIDSNSAAISSTTNAMMTALDDIFNSNNNAETSSQPSTVVASSPSDRSEDNQPPSSMSSITQTHQSEPETVAGLQSIIAQDGIAPRMAPDAISKSRKRARLDEEFNEEETFFRQPNRKVRCFDSLETGSVTQAPRSGLARTLRRSSRAGKGERRHDSNFFWYNTAKTKSLSKKGLSEDPVSQPTIKEVKSKRDQADAVNKPRHGMEKEVANQDSEDSVALLFSEFEGRKRVHADIQEVGDTETSRGKVRCTGFSKVVLESSKTASAAPQVAALARPLRSSLRLAKQEVSAIQEFHTRLVAAPKAVGTGRKHERQVDPEFDIWEEGPAKKIKNNGLQTAPAPNAGLKP